MKHKTQEDLHILSLQAIFLSSSQGTLILCIVVCRITEYADPRVATLADQIRMVNSKESVPTCKKVVQKKLVQSCEKGSACLQPAQAGHARLVLNKTVTFLCTMLYTFERSVYQKRVSIFFSFEACCELAPTH